MNLSPCPQLLLHSSHIPGILFPDTAVPPLSHPCKIPFPGVSPSLPKLGTALRKVPVTCTMPRIFLVWASRCSECSHLLRGLWRCWLAPPGFLSLAPRQCHQPALGPLLHISPGHSFPSALPKIGLKAQMPRFPSRQGCGEEPALAAPQLCSPPAAPGPGWGP